MQLPDTAAIRDMHGMSQTTQLTPAKSSLVITYGTAGVVTVCKTIVLAGSLRRGAWRIVLLAAGRSRPLGAEVRPSPLDPGRVASLDSASSGEGRQLRGGRPRSRHSRADTRSCKRICKRDAAEPAEPGETGRMREMPDSHSPSWATTRGTCQDGGDGRRTAHNPEVAGSNPAPATKVRGPFRSWKGPLSRS